MARRGCRPGMTLVELLVAVALGMAIIAMAWTAFVRAGTSTTRATARVDLHATAAVCREYLNDDLGNLAPTIAFFARSTPQVAATDPDGTPIRTDTVELLFMRTVTRLGSETTGDTGQQCKSEFRWVRWRFVRTWRQSGGAWLPVAGRLYRSASTPAREFTTLATWTPPAPLVDPIPANLPWTDYKGARFLNLPRPLRDASQGIASLDNNRYGIADAVVDHRGSAMGDIGDLQDLDLPANDRLVTARVRDLAIGWVDAGGSQVAVTSSAAADRRIDGLYLDITGPAHNPYLSEIARRPRVVRVAFNLDDPAAGVSQDFCFSIATPGLQPQIGQP